VPDCEIQMGGVRNYSHFMAFYGILYKVYGATSEQLKIDFC
jgi:hypothetical protein